MMSLLAGLAAPLGAGGIVDATAGSMRGGGGGRGGAAAGV